MQLLKLHEHPNYMNDCCELLNQEWPRSETARLHCLEQSSDNFPMSFVLIDDHQNLIGHVKIRKESDSKAVVESLIIKPENREQGLGRYLMNQVEHFLREENFKQISLFTTDKESFYQKLGYNLVNKNMFDFSNDSHTLTPKHHSGKFVLLAIVNQINCHDYLDCKLNFQNTDLSQRKAADCPPPPPPPPPTPLSFNYDQGKKLMMKRI